MSKTISLHNGSVSCREHNIRNPKYTAPQKHIDPTLSENNIYLFDDINPETSRPYDMSYDTFLRKKYAEIFQEAIDEYNAKQKRSDRKISDYYEKIKADKQKHTVYECIVQIGDRETTGINAEAEKKALERFAAEWEQRNPNLRLIGAYIHCDEPDGTVHMHCDYIPVAVCSRGMTLQNSLDRALTQQGIKSGKSIHETAQILWEKREREVLLDICTDMGIDTTLEQTEKGRKHLETPEFKAEKKRMEAELRSAEEDKAAKIAEYAEATALDVKVPDGVPIFLNKEKKKYSVTEVEILSKQAAMGKAVYEDSVKRTEEANAVIAERDSIIAAANTEAERIKSESVAKTEYVKKKRERSEAKLAEVDAEIDRKEQQKATIEADIDLKQQEKSDLEHDIEETSDRLGNLQRLYDEKMEELGAVEARLINPMKERDEQIRSLERSLSSERSSNSSLKRENSKLNSLIENKDTEIQTMHAALYKTEECEKLTSFVKNLLVAPWRETFKVIYDPETEKFSIEGSYSLTTAASETYGTPIRNGYELTLELLNRHIEETAPEQEKQLNIWERMSKWAESQSSKVKNLVNNVKSALYGVLEKIISKKDAEIEELQRKHKAEVAAHNKDNKDYNILLGQFETAKEIADYIAESSGYDDLVDNWDYYIQKRQDGYRISYLLGDEKGRSR